MDIQYEYYFAPYDCHGYYTYNDDNKCSGCGDEKIEYVYNGFKFCVICYSQIEEEV